MMPSLTMPAYATGPASAPAALGWPAWLTPRAGRTAERTIAPTAVREDRSRDLDELLLATASGDRRAFERLYHLSSAALHTLIRRTIWQRCDAEEVLQEVYVKVWRHAHSFDPRQALAMTWMARIARNHAIDHLRRCSARSTHEVAVDGNDADAGDGRNAYAPDELADDAPAPQQALEQRQQSEMVDGLLARLPPSQRQVLLLAFREGLSHAEIAEKLDAPLGTVKSWMRRGLSAIKDLLDTSETGHRNAHTPRTAAAASR